MWWDDKLHGFGVRATPTGSVSFLVQYRNAQGRSRRITIGPWGAYTPAAAREEAEELLRDAHAARKGKAVDPAERKLAERNAITFKELADEYMEKARAGLIIGQKGRPKKPGTVAIDKYRVAHLVSYFGVKADQGYRPSRVPTLHREAHCRPPWRRSDVRAAWRHLHLCDRARLRGQQSGARHTETGRRPAGSSGWMPTGYRALGQALEAAEARAEPWQAVGAIRLLALTGCRKGEIRKLRLTEVDLQGRCLRLGDTKTGQSIRPLGEPALRVLRSSEPAESPRPASSSFRAETPASPSTASAGPPKVPARIVGSEYSAHGLRHAFASACDELGLSELTIATLLGHASAKERIDHARLHQEARCCSAGGCRCCQSSTYQTRWPENPEDK